MMSAPTLLVSPLLPAAGDSLRPLIVALVVFAVAVVAVIVLMFLRKKR